MLVFRKILCTCLMDDPLISSKQVHFHIFNIIIVQLPITCKVYEKAIHKLQ